MYALGAVRRYTSNKTNKTPQNITMLKSYLLYFFYIASCLKKSLRNFEGKKFLPLKELKKLLNFDSKYYLINDYVKIRF